MHARVQRYVLSAAVALVLLLVGKVAEAQNLRVIPVPWVATKPSLPHYAYNDHPTTLKAIARGGNGSYTVQWDPEGDGTFLTSYATTNRYNLEQVFQYPDVAVTTTYQARIRVTSGAQTVDAIYPVRIFPSAPIVPCVVVPSTGCVAGTTPTLDADLQIMRNVAIDDGLWYLHKQMNRTGNEEDAALGSQASGNIPGSYPLPASAGFLWSLGLNGHYAAYNSSYVGVLPDPAMNTQRFEQDPLAEDAARLINYLLSNAQVIAIPTADESNLVGFPEVDQAPIAGTDDLKAIVWSNNDTYFMGHILSGLSKANLSGYVAQVGNAADILGRRMEYVLQQVIDGLAYSQIDSNLGNNEGSWHYNSNPSNDDLSTTLWAATGLWHADEFGGDELIISNRVKGRLAQYIAVNSRVNPANAAQRCGSYETEYAGCQHVISAAHMLVLGWIGANTKTSGDAALAFPGYSTASNGTLRDYYDMTLAFISGNFYGTVANAVNWNIGITNDGNFARNDRRINHYGMLHWQDAARAVVPAVETFGAANWYRHFTDYLMRNQETDGRWDSINNSLPGTNTDDYGGVYLTTVWGLLVLQPDAIPPLAIAEATPTTSTEGTPIFFDGSESDPGSAVFTGYTWDFGNGDTLTGETVSYAFPDNGTYNVTLTLASVGGSTTATIPVTITNLPPAPIAGPAGLVPEGSSVPFFAFPNDPGTGDTHTYAWTFGDGSTGTGQTPTHVYVDDGNFQVNLRVTDDDGAFGDYSFLVIVTNVPPTITSVPPTQAYEDVAYSYTVTYVDAGSTDTATCSAPTMRPGMTLTGCTLDWPNPQLGDNGPVRVCVTDNDGGQACQSFNVEVDFVDTDNDGLPDTWEDDNFGNLDHGATGDEDGDGIGNIDEFTGGTDPNGYDGPDQLVAYAPTCGTEVAGDSVELVVEIGSDPQDYPLTYWFELYRDEALTDQVGAGPVDDDGLDEYVSTGPAPAGLVEENTWYYWRARAADQWTSGPWSDVCSFFVNSENEAPGAPGINSPAIGSWVNDVTPDLVIDNATDVDALDTLDYRFEIYSDAALTTLVAAESGVAEDVDTSACTVTVALTEDATYYWRARATDNNGASGEWSETGVFTVNSENAPPEAPVIVAPQNATVVAVLRPTLILLNPDDPDFDTLVYDWELATDSTFADVLDSGDDQAQGGPATTAFALAADLDEDTRYCWRVRADDGASTSAYATACFLVSELNDPPSVPALMNPGNDTVVRTMSPTFSWAPSADPEGEAVSYDVEVLDADGNVVATALGVSGTVTAMAEDLADGEDYTWRARAVDARGLASQYSEANQFAVVLPVDGGGGDPGIVVNGAGCAAGGGSGGGLALLGLGLIAGLRRRRRRD